MYAERAVVRIPWQRGRQSRFEVQPQKSFHLLLKKKKAKLRLLNTEMVLESRGIVAMTLCTSSATPADAASSEAASFELGLGAKVQMTFTAGNTTKVLRRSPDLKQCPD